MRRSVADRAFLFAGFDKRRPEDRAYFAPAAALALALAALPFLLHLTVVDTDRALSLVFIPAFWLSHKIRKPSSSVDAWLLTWAAAAMLASALLAPHTARALVMTAAVGWTIAGAVAARDIAACRPAIRLVLSGIVASSVVGMIMVMMGVGKEAMFFPTYWSARLFGGHQFVGCLAALGLLASSKPRSITQSVCFIAVIVVWTGLAWSGSRAPALGLAVGVGCWFCRGTAGERRVLLYSVPLLTALALPLSYLLGNPYPQLGWWEAVTRTSEAAGIEAVTSERWRFWTVTFQHALTAPWLGWGADSYLYIHPAQNGNQPHNVLLQWFLEYGVLGAVPLVVLLMRTMSGLVANTVSRVPDNAFSVWAPACLMGSVAYGLFDGVFYHMIVFMPVAVLAGFAIGQRKVSAQAGNAAWMRPAGRMLLLGSIAILLLHNSVHLMLVRGQNITPDSPPARVLRIFPSTTFGLKRWIEAWRTEQPELAMEWIKWAQNASIQQPAFHVYAAQLYIWQKDYPAAEAEMMQCLAKGHYLERPDFENVIANLRRLEAEKSVDRNTVNQPQALPLVDDRR